MSQPETSGDQVALSSIATLVLVASELLLPQVLWHRMHTSMHKILLRKSLDTEAAYRVKDRLQLTVEESSSSLATGWLRLDSIRLSTVTIFCMLAMASSLADRTPKELFLNLKRSTKEKKHGFCTEEVPMQQPKQEQESVKKVGALATIANISAARYAA